MYIIKCYRQQRVIWPNLRKNSINIMHNAHKDIHCNVKYFILKGSIKNAGIVKLNDHKSLWQYCCQIDKLYRIGVKNHVLFTTILIFEQNGACQTHQVGEGCLPIY
jgi:hypothetical protein